MSERSPDKDSILSQPEMELSRLLDEARGLSQRSLERVRLLKELFPGELRGTALDDLERLEADARHDRRRTPRFAENPARVLVSPSRSPGEGVIARVRDHSATGVCLRLDWPTEVGTILWMRPTTALPEERWVPLEVRHCRSETRGWLVGCQFVSKVDAT
ncbi:MAG: PilZ domain-containing protein [Planctomycetes bacterium]|nr:PilZ domain-containing protein [Planctomycetota bacterium]